MPLFGCRTGWNGPDSRPPHSPHGNQRAVVPLNTILPSSDDYLFPLSESLKGCGRLRQSIRSPDNWYIVFLYVKASATANLQTYIDMAWMEQWRIEHHPYLCFEGTNWAYASSINGRKVWCKFLIPYSIEFDAETTRWEMLKDLNSWTDGAHIVTEMNVGEMAKRLGLYI